MNFDLLPLEIKSHVFSFLPFDDLYFKVANVCKQWQTITRDRHVVKHIEINQRFDSEEIILCLTNYNLAQSLKITKVVLSECVREIPVINNIRRLQFHNCRFDQTTLPFLLTRFPKISNLKLSGYCEYLLPDVCNQRSTAKFYFHNISSDFVQLFAENCERLEEIDIAGSFDVNEESFQTLVNLHRTSLKKLSVIGDVFIQKNFNALARCRQIVDLKLFRVIDMTNTQLLTIKRLRFLRKLSLQGACRVSEKGIIRFLTEPPFSHLQSIKLPSCENLSNDVIDSISRSYPNLKSLDISNCFRIKNTGVLSVINNCSVIEDLNLSFNCRITEKILDEIPSHLPHLKYLNVSGCTKMMHIDFYECRLTTSHPNLRFIH